MSLKPSTIWERVHREAIRSCQPGVLGQLARERVQAEQAAAGDVRGTIARLEKELREVEAQETQQENLVLAGARPERVRERMQALQKERSHILAQLSAAREVFRREQAPDLAAARAEAEAARILHTLETAYAAQDIPALRDAYASLLTAEVSPKGKVKLTIAERLLVGYEAE